MYPTRDSLWMIVLYQSVLRTTELHSSSTPIQLGGGEFTKSDYNRGKAILESPLLTDSGRRWLVRYCDPFHDNQVNPSGYPDMDQSSTVVQEVNITKNISVPSTVTSGNNWDCHIFNWADFAFMADYGLTNCSPATYDPLTGRLGSGTPFTEYSMGGVIALGGPVGSKFLPELGTGSISTGTKNIAAANPYQYLGAKSRVVGMAFEVINTTAELYLQGSTVAYRMPQIESDIVISQLITASDGTTAYVPMPAKAYALPPSTVEEALVLPASKQWEAKEGAYVVCTLMDVDNPMRRVENVPRIYLEHSVASPAYPQAWDEADPISCVASGCTYNAQTVSLQTYPAIHSSFNTSGVYLTGLSYQTTLQLNVKFLIEASPGPRSQLATLARPSPDYDPEALRLAAQIMSHAPVGVPFSMNPTGEWWGEILGVLGDVSTLASAINPMFGLIGRGLGIAKNFVPKIVNTLQDTKRKPSKPKEEESETFRKAVRAKQPVALNRQERAKAQLKSASRNAQMNKFRGPPRRH